MSGGRAAKKEKNVDANRATARNPLMGTCFVKRRIRLAPWKLQVRVLVIHGRVCSTRNQRRSSFTVSVIPTRRSTSLFLQDRLLAVTIFLRLVRASKPYILLPYREKDRLALHSNDGSLQNREQRWRRSDHLMADMDMWLSSRVNIRVGIGSF